MPERRRHGVWVAAGVLVAAGAAGGGAVAAGQGGPSYRTGTATKASVKSLLTVSGTAQPVSRASVDFGAAGTVQSVDVAVGATVTAGQTLASLVPATLQQALTTAETQLAAAQAALHSDEESQGSDSARATTGPSTGTGSSASPSAATVTKGQQAVVADQATLDTDQQTAATDLATAQTACGGAATAGHTASGGTGGTPTGTPTHTGTGTHTGTPGHSGSGSSGAPTTTTTTGAATPAASSTPSPTAASTSAACKAALTTALGAETQVADDEKALTHDESTLAQALSAESSSAGTTGGQSGSHASIHTTGSAVTPAQLASDQETIDNDEAAVIEAQQSLAAASLVSPIAGSVVSVGVSQGQVVTAGDSSEAITVVSADAFEATATLSASDAAGVKVGDTASVRVVGQSRPLRGTVTRVGPVDVNNGNTYPLIVSLPGSLQGVFTGTQAQISIVLARAAGALVVPTPAVRTVSSGHALVDVDHAGQVTPVSVTVGVVGNVYTQILSGIHTGQTVVIADMTTPVPTSNSTSPFGGVNALSGNTPTFGQFVGPAGGGGTLHITFHR